MSFQTTSFIYDGVPSEAYGLALANFNGAAQAASNYGGTLTIHEDRFNGRSTGLHYGTTLNGALSFPITMTVCQDNTYMDRYDQAAVVGWLTGHKGYKPLVICQADMEGVYYRALITNLQACEVGMRQMGYTATVMCDGPYAYRRMTDTVIQAAGETDLIYRNMSNLSAYYYPAIEIACSGETFTMTNHTDGTVFQLSGMPAADRTIYIDSQNKILRSSDGLNLYQYWNTDVPKMFPRMLRGDNALSVSGQCVVTIKNDFPWNVGH